MSFTIYVPCDCNRKGQINFPPFKEKLIFENGIWDIAPEFLFDDEFEKVYESWDFCMHDQTAMEFDLSQGIIKIKPYLEEKYSNDFEEVKKFLPEYNGWVNTDYDKEKALKELQKLKILEPSYKNRIKQFIALLETAIKSQNEIYWD